MFTQKLESARGL